MKGVRAHSCSLHTIMFISVSKSGEEKSNPRPAWLGTKYYLVISVSGGGQLSLGYGLALHVLTHCPLSSVSPGLHGRLRDLLPSGSGAL